jgi:hypothetical protein
MHTRKHIKIIKVDNYMAEVEVEIIESYGQGWSPYISLEDSLKLDNIREALKDGNLEEAKTMAKIYTLSPVAA